MHSKPLLPCGLDWGLLKCSPAIASYPARSESQIARRTQATCDLLAEMHDGWLPAG